MERHEIKRYTPESYVQHVQNMYHGSRTYVKCIKGYNDAFRVIVGLQQGSKLSPFLFMMMID